ncbi:MAG: hypothetical protein ACON5B_07140 [Myxococcota bacterium]
MTLTLRDWIRAAQLCVLGVILAMVGPPTLGVVELVREDIRLDQIVIAAALDWRDFGHENAVNRLMADMDASDLKAISDTDCRWVDDTPGIYEIRCAWAHELKVALVERTFELSFSSQARVSHAGLLPGRGSLASAPPHRLP